MTATSCLVDITTDASLMKRVRDNWFCNDASGTAPVFFPTGPSGYWPQILRSWCEQNSTEWESFPAAIYGIRAKMSRDSVLAFVSACYDEMPMYTNPEHMLTWKGQAYLAIGLINFRAFLAQNLKRNRKYYVLATEDG